MLDVGAGGDHCAPSAGMSPTTATDLLPDTIDAVVAKHRDTPTASPPAKYWLGLVSTAAGGGGGRGGGGGSLGAGEELVIPSFLHLLRDRLH